MKINYRNHLIISVFFALPLLVNAQNIEQKILSRYFPSYNKANNCWVAETEQGTYCMKLDASKTVKTSAGEKKYLLATGSLYDFTRNETTGGHANSGNVAMFVLQKTNHDWRVLSAKTEITVGTFGNARTDWSFHQFGPDTYGFLNTHGDVHQGYAGSHYVILTPDKNKITEHWIGATVDNTGAIGLTRKSNLVDSSIKIDRSKEIQSGLYPLIITVNGRMGSKRFNQKSYTINYDNRAQKYVEPKDYPLRDIDY